jgi:hypothetical protein
MSMDAGLLAAIVGARRFSAAPIGGPFDLFLDPIILAGGHTLSVDKRTLTNASGGSDYRRWNTTPEPMPSDDQIYYWEIACGAGPTASNGYLGVVSQEQYGSATLGPQTTTNPIDVNSVGYRGNGSVWRNGGQILTGLPTYGNGSIVMFAFNPVSGELWVGKDGVWRDDPTSGAATATATSPGNIYYPSVQTRDAGEVRTLRTTPARFSYPVPAGLVSLGYKLFTFGVTVPFAASYAILGTPVNALALRKSNSFVILGTPVDAASVRSSKTFVVLE